MKLAISERDKLLLCLVGSVLLVFLAWYFGFRNLNDKTAALESEISTLQVKYDDLSAKKSNAKKYAQDTEGYDLLCDAWLSRFDSGFSQKATLILQAILKLSLACG